MVEAAQKIPLYRKKTPKSNMSLADLGKAGKIQFESEP